MQTTTRQSKARKAAAIAANEQSKAEETQPRAPQNGISKNKGPTPKPPPKRAMYQLRSQLIKRLDGQDQEELEQQQARLLRRASVALAEDGLELPVVLDAAAVTLPDRPPPPTHNNWKDGRRSRFAKRYVDATEFLDPDEHDELGLSGRHIPQIGLRRRVGKKPAKVPFAIWMAYKQLDEFVYRRSLSDEEVAALPTDDDAFDFQGSDGQEPPSLPTGFRWGAQKKLVDARQWADSS